jgi:hypothetical protein
MSFHRFSIQKSIWNLSLKQRILLTSFGCPRNTVWTLEHVLSKQTFEYSWWTWFVQTTFVATDCCAAWKVLIRRSTFFAGVTQPIHSDLGHLVVAHIAILNMYLKKSLRLFWVGFCYSAQHPGVKTRCRADLIPACFAQMGPAGIKNWAAKNLWEVLVKSRWWFLLGTHHCYKYYHRREWAQTSK